MRVTALAPWFGSNRMLAENVGKALEGCAWVGVPFAGGMCELAHIGASTILASDLHRHIINLARVVAHPKLGPQLYRRLRRRVFHVEEHAFSQTIAKRIEPGDSPDIDVAEHYFVAVWQGRSARAGQSSEFTGSACVRWTGSGGSSATRYRSAVQSLRSWMKIFKRCDFVVMDAMDFLERADDRPGHGIYCDPPFPDAGDSYKHSFGEKEHRALAAKLAGFRKALIVCRFYDHPLIRELYPESEWAWNRLKGRDQANNAEKPEVLLVRNERPARKRQKAGPTLFA